MKTNKQSTFSVATALLFINKYSYLIIALAAIFLIYPGVFLNTLYIQSIVSGIGDVVDLSYFNKVIVDSVSFIFLLFTPCLLARRQGGN